MYYLSEEVVVFKDTLCLGSSNENKKYKNIKTDTLRVTSDYTKKRSESCDSCSDSDSDSESGTQKFIPVVYYNGENESVT